MPKRHMNQRSLFFTCVYCGHQCFTTYKGLNTPCRCPARVNLVSNLSGHIVDWGVSWFYGNCLILSISWQIFYHNSKNFSFHFKHYNLSIHVVNFCKTFCTCSLSSQDKILWLKMQFYFYFFRLGFLSYCRLLAAWALLCLIFFLSEKMRFGKTKTSFHYLGNL
jgi:hypothetical protein